MPPSGTCSWTVLNPIKFWNAASLIPTPLLHLKLLLLAPTYKTGWTIPGGVMESTGETPWEACRREVFEETGLRVAASDLLGPVVTRTVVHGYSDQVLSQHETFFDG